MWKKIFIPVIVLLGLGIMAFTAHFGYKGTMKKPATLETGAYPPVVVLELFTSQGCSSCPPADELLNKIKEEQADNVFTLSYHVDYWNYIGWKDPFSKLEYTKKQRKYNLKFSNNSNYTPQLVINGKEQLVGSNSAKIYQKIGNYQKIKTSNKVTLSEVNRDTKNIIFAYKITGDVQGKIMRAVLVLDQRITEVNRGENKNRTLKNSNIVVAEKSFSINNTAGTASLALPEIVGNEEKIQLVLLVEKGNYDITGAAKAIVKG